MRRQKLTAAYLLLSLFSWPTLQARELPDHRWEILAVTYPPDRNVSVVLGGADKTLTSRGVCTVKWRNDVATVSLKLKNLPAPQEIGWAGRQYVLWAIDSERRMLNLGPVPLGKNEAQWEVQVPFRSFGLLVTAEADLHAQAPSTAVALESLLPTDRSLVVPVPRVTVNLVQPPG